MLEFAKGGEYMEENQEQTSSPAPKSNSSLMVVAAVVILVIVVGGGFFAYKKLKHAAPAQQQVMSEQAAPTTTTAMQPTTANNPSGAMAATQTITVTGSNYSFDPKEIHVKKGQNVAITFKNVAGFHNFVIDELNVKTPIIKTGETASVSFTADKAGTFEYYCSVANHRAMGMKGELYVE